MKWSGWSSWILGRRPSWGRPHCHLDPPSTPPITLNPPVDLAVLDERLLAPDPQLGLFDQLAQRGSRTLGIGELPPAAQTAGQLSSVTLEVVGDDPRVVALVGVAVQR